MICGIMSCKNCAPIYRLKIITGLVGSKPPTRHFSTSSPLVWRLLYCREGFRKILLQLTTMRAQIYNMRQTRLLNVNEKVLLRGHSIRANLIFQILWILKKNLHGRIRYYCYRSKTLLTSFFLKSNIQWDHNNFDVIFLF